MSNTCTLQSPLSENIRATLERITRICNATGSEFFVAGAMAREVLLTHVHGRSTGRHTRDIDIAVLIKDWAQFTLLKNSMLAQGAAEIPGNVQRVLWEGVEIDILPFGGIAQGNEIRWPPELAVAMSVEGFAEAYANTLTIEIPECGDVRFSSLPGLLLLKLFAWRARGDEYTKDAVDIHKILHEYQHVEASRLYDNDEWGESVDWDPERMGALLAGSDVATLMSAENRESLHQFDMQKLVDVMVRQRVDVSEERIELLVSDFWKTLLG